MNERAVPASHASAAVGAALLSPLLRLLPRESAALAGRAAWLCPLLALFPLLALTALLTALRRQARPGEGAAELMLRAGGPVLGRAALLAYGGWFLFYTGFILRSGAERLTAAVYQSSRAEPFLLVLMLISLVIALGALRAAGRMGRILRGVLVVALAFVFALALSNVAEENLLPLRGGELPSLLSGAVPVVTVGAVAGLLSFLGGYLDPGPAPLRRVLGPTLLLVLLSMLLCFETVGTFGAALTSRLSYPFFTLTRDISLMHPAPRIEALVIVLWVLADLYLCALLLRCAHEALRTVLSLPKPEGGPFFSPGRGRWLLWLEAPAAYLFARYLGASADRLLLWSRTLGPLVTDIAVFGGLPLLWLTLRIRKNR